MALSQFSTAHMIGSDRKGRMLGDIKNGSSCSEFSTQGFFSSSTTIPYSSSKDFCPFSIRQSQLSMHYKYDVLLLYDPEENSFFVDKLVKYLQPQNLNIFDFLRDSPPGLPQRKVLQSALHNCRYTCILITRRFIHNFWLQLKTDMSIQDMLDNQHKLYSVIVVVMDSDVKKEHLPLDLATLSPLFCSEKFFENRLKLAFSKDAAFPVVEPSSLAKFNFVSENENEFPPPVRSTCIDDFGDGGNNKDFKSSKRQPHEHGDSSFLMPSSVSMFKTKDIPETSSAILRGMSVTVHSTGARKPTETLDSSLSQDRETAPLYTYSKFKSSNKDANSSLPSFSYQGLDQKQFPPLVSLSHKGTLNDPYKVDDFTFLANIYHNIPHIDVELETEKFKDIPEFNSGSMISEFSELEISLDKSIQSGCKDYLDNTNLESDCSMDFRSPVSGLEISVNCSVEKAESIATDEISSGNHDADLLFKDSKQSNEACASLPADLSSIRPKKYTSIRSLVSESLHKVKKRMSFHRKREKK